MRGLADCRQTPSLRDFRGAQQAGRDNKGLLPVSRGGATQPAGMHRKSQKMEFCHNLPGLLARKVRISAFIVFCTVLYSASEVKATWYETNRVVINSAQTLEEGEITIGLFMPLQYGIYDWLMFQAHPLLFLLISPNTGFKIKFLDSSVVLSLSLSYSQTFLRSKENEFPGSVQIMPQLSIPLGDVVVATLGSGYMLDIDPINHNTVMLAGMNILVNESNLILGQVSLTYNNSTNTFELPQGLVMYVHAWHSFHLGVGAMIGSILFRRGQSPEDVIDLPVYPVLDVWWRF